MLSADIDKWSQAYPYNIVCYVVRVQDKPQVGVALLRLQAAPAGERTVHEKCPMPVAMLSSQPLFSFNEVLSVAFGEVVAGQRHLAAHQRVVHEFNEIGLIDLGKALKGEGHAGLP